MYNRIVFKPYKNGLGGLGLIKEKLTEKNVKVLEIKTQGSKYKQKHRDKVINWGVQHGGKRNQFSSFRNAGVPCSDWSGDFQEAKQWIEQGHRVLCRTILNGHGGAGIVVAENLDDLVDAPLYVKYIPKKREFRVHLVLTPNGVHPYNIKVREKRRRAGWEQLEDFNKYIRNHDNGWVFCDEFKDELPEGLETVCASAVTALDLSFGAVDLGFHPLHGFIVYEVNTAPGLCESTANFYAEEFIKMLDN